MRTVAALAVLIAVAAPAAACPWWGRSCQPRPVVYYPYCPPPVAYYDPPPVVRVVRVVEAKPAEPARDPDAAPDGWSHIRGRVVYDGGDPLPVRKLIPMSGGAYTEDWVVNPKNRGVQNVVVWLAPEPSQEQWERLRAKGSDRLLEFPNFTPEQVYHKLPKPKDRTVLIPERPILFMPHVVAVQAGTTVTFQNVSTRPEHVKWTSRNNGEVNALVPPDGRELQMKDTRPERFPIEITSSIHPWMKAYVRVFDHPYFAVTGADGEFEIKYAPRGNLRLVLWQEDMGFRNGREGRWGEPIRAPNGRLDLGEISLRPPAKK